jgi:hypothetical protein
MVAALRGIFERVSDVDGSGEREWKKSTSRREEEASIRRALTHT